MKQTANNTTILALDVGGRRIGVARANMLARLPAPLTTLTNDGQIFDKLKKLVEAENASALVIGLPRGLQGQETEQTKITREFYSKLKEQLDLPLYLQDEAVTSKKAEQELYNSKRGVDKQMVDALAATYILEDFLRRKDSPKGVNYD